MRGVWHTLIIVSALALVVGCQGGGGSGGGAAATAGAGVQSDSGSADDDAGGDTGDVWGDDDVRHRPQRTVLIEGLGFESIDTGAGDAARL